MALKIPLVLGAAGRPQQLQAGDTLMVSSLTTLAGGVPTTISGLLIWLSADSITLLDNQFVGHWFDASNLSNHLRAQDTKLSRTQYRTGQVNGLPAVVFNGGSPQFTIVSPADLGLTTIFVVFKPGTVSGTHDFVSGPAGSLSLVLNGTHLQLVKTTVAVIATDTVALSAGTWYQANVTYNANTGDYAFRANRAAGASGANAVSVTAETSAWGYQAVNATEYLSGSVAEFIVYNRVLSGGEITTIETYLNGKYAL